MSFPIILNIRELRIDFWRILTIRNTRPVRLFITLPINHLPLPGKNYFQFYYKQYHKAIRWYLIVTDIYLIHTLSFQVRFGQTYLITLARIMQSFDGRQRIKDIRLELGQQIYPVNDNHHHDELL